MHSRGRSPKGPWSVRHPDLAGIAIALATFVVVVVVHSTLKQYSSGGDPILISGALAGGLTGLLGWLALRGTGELERHFSQTAEAVADLNHNIRNALDTMAMSAHLAESETAETI